MPPGPHDVVVVGQSLGGYTALRAVLEHPETFGGALAQSPSLWQGELTGLARRACGTGDGVVPRAWIEVGLQEWVLLDPVRRFCAAFAESGAEVERVEYNGGHDWACWRGGVADGLCWLLPPTGSLART